MSQVSIDDLTRVLASKEEVKLLNSFFVLYKTARIVEENSAMFKNQATTFYDQLKICEIDSDSITLKVVGGRYFVNEKLARFDGDGLSGASAVIEEWKSLGVGGVQFLSGITKKEVEEFVKFMSKVRPRSLNLEALAMSLKTHQMSSVKLLSYADLTQGGSVLPREMRQRFRSAARTTFFRAISVVQEAVHNTQEDRQINVSKTKRVVHSLIDQISRDESSLIELSSIKDYDDYTYAHSANVCVYSLTLGVRLNMDRTRLSQLGFSALFHDVGKVKLPTDLIRKPDAYDENDWIQMQLHPALGAKTILRNMRLDTHTARAARGAFEHHINKDFTGYPKLIYRQRPLNLFSKIISIADTFDALTSGRVYLKRSIPVDEVLKKMHYQMSIKFDPLLLEIFNDIIGVYPAGSLVLLTSDEIALVLTNNEQLSDRPYIQVVGNRDGLLDEPEWVDLSSEVHAHRKIVRLIDPKRYGLDVKAFVLGD